MKKKVLIICMLLSTMFVVDSSTMFDCNPCIAFTASARDTNSDGYIYKGKVYLTRVGSRNKEAFLLFDKRGVKYVAKYKSGPYYKLTRRIKIDNVDYIYE